MKRRALVLIIGFLSISIISTGQRAILLNGESQAYDKVEIQDESIDLIIGNDKKSIEKSSLLCVVPEKKSSYTFTEKNKKKIAIKQKDIQTDYQNADIIRILAYKYYGSEQEAKELYHYNPSDNITEEEFVQIFNDTQKSITGRVIVNTTIALVAATAALIIGLSSFLGSLKDTKQYSYIVPYGKIEPISMVQSNAFEAHLLYAYRKRA